MCGLFGWIRAENCPLTVGQTETLTAALAVLSEQRGRDSTGIASYRLSEEAPTVARTVFEASAFVTRRREDLVAACRPGAGWVLGHTRAKTQGEVSIANTHPFTFGDLLGAHNGVVMNDLQLKDQLSDVKLPGCDSAVLFALAAKIGMTAALAETRGTLNLTWSTAPYNTLNLYQDIGSGLYLAFVPAWHMAIWASNDDYIEQACAILGQSVEYDAEGKAPGYYMAVGVEKIAELTADSVSGKHCAFTETDAPTKGRVYVSNGGRWDNGTWKYDDDFTSHTPKAGYHPSAYNSGLYHKGKKRACQYCKDHRRSSYGHNQRQLGFNNGALTQSAMVTAPKSAVSRLVTVEKPLKTCPNCQRMDRLEQLIDDTWDWYECLACGVSIELLSDDYSPDTEAVNVMDDDSQYVSD